MEKHVSLETGKRLGKAGWEEGTYWIITNKANMENPGEWYICSADSWRWLIEKQNKEGYETCKFNFYWLPDIPELLEELPDNVKIHRSGSQWIVSYSWKDDKGRTATTGGCREQLIEILAELWIKLHSKS